MKKVMKILGIIMIFLVALVAVFLIVTYHGIQTSYVLAGSYDVQQISGKYDSGKMFSCMAETIILMMGCNFEQQ